MFSARNLAAQGQAEEAERLTRASVDRLRACGDHWMILYGLGMLAGIEESHGDFSAAAAAYEELIKACRSAGTVHFESMWLIRLATLRARLGDDLAAEQLFADSIATHLKWPELRPSSGGPERPADLATSPRVDAGWKRPTPTTSLSAFRRVGPGPHRPRLVVLVRRGPDGRRRYAEQARDRASEAADPLVAILAETVAAAVALASSDTEANRARFADVLEQRAAAGRSAAFFEATLDDPDVEALAAAHGLRSA